MLPGNYRKLKQVHMQEGEPLIEVEVFQTKLRIMKWWSTSPKKRKKPSKEQQTSQAEWKFHRLNEKMNHMK